MSAAKTNPNDLLNNMSIREYMATHIMAGFAANPEVGGTPEGNAALAVKMADALIEALNKKEDIK